MIEKHRLREAEFKQRSQLRPLQKPVVPPHILKSPEWVKSSLAQSQKTLNSPVLALKWIGVPFCCHCCLEIMQMQWACTDIVLPWKDTHNKLSLNTVKETFSSYSGVFEAGWGCSPRGGGCDTWSLGPVIHVVTHCSSAHSTAKFKKALPSPYVNHGTW